jgi:hypothetical protein
MTSCPRFPFALFSWAHPPPHLTINKSWYNTALMEREREVNNQERQQQKIMLDISYK